MATVAELPARKADSKHGSAFVGVHTSGQYEGSTIFVLIDDRSTFDLIDLPVTDHGPKEHGHVITKSIEAKHQHIIFQYWLKSISALEETSSKVIA